MAATRAIAANDGAAAAAPAAMVPPVELRRYGDITKQAALKDQEFGGRRLP